MSKKPRKILEVHELEDHVAYLKLLTGSLGKEEIKRVKRASQLVTDNDLNLVESVDEAFKHMICLLEKPTATLTAN